MRIKWTDEKKKQNSKKMQKARTQTRLHIQFLSIVIECEIFREAKHFFSSLALSSLILSFVHAARDRKWHSNCWKNATQKNKIWNKKKQRKMKKEAKEKILKANYCCVATPSPAVKRELRRPEVKYKVLLLLLFIARCCCRSNDASSKN